MGKTILKLLTTWLHSNITPFSRVIVPVVIEFTGTELKMTHVGPVLRKLGLFMS